MARRNCMYAHVGCHFQVEEDDVLHEHEEDKSVHLITTIMFCECLKQELEKTKSQLKKLEEAHFALQVEQTKLRKKYLELEVLSTKEERQKITPAVQDLAPQEVSTDQTSVNNIENQVSDMIAHSNEISTTNEFLPNATAASEKSLIEEDADWIDAKTIDALNEVQRYQHVQLRKIFQFIAAIKDDTLNTNLSDVVRKYDEMSNTVEKKMQDNQEKLDNIYTFQNQQLKKWTEDFEKEKVKLLALEQKHFSSLTEEMKSLKAIVESNRDEMDRRLTSLTTSLQELQESSKASGQQVSKNIPDEERKLDMEMFDLRGYAPDCVYDWRINNFAEILNDLRSSNSPCYQSEPFSSAKTGYNFCLILRFIPSGLYLDLCILQGERDDQLKWPIVCKLTLELVDQLNRTDHLNKSVTSRRIDKPTSAKYIGNSSLFISHFQLGNERYLINNSVHFRCIIHEYI